MNRTVGRSFIVPLAFAVLVASQGAAEAADSSNLGQALNTVGTSFAPVWGMVKALLLPLGLAMMFRGLVNIKDAGDPRRSPVAGFVQLFAGAAMITVPRFTEVLAQSVGIATAVGSKSSFDVGAMDAAAGGSGVLAIAGRFFSIVSGPLAAVALSFAFIAGVCLIVKGLYDCVAMANPEGGRRVAMGGLAATFIVGATLTNLSGLMAIVSATFGFGDISASSLLASSSNAASMMSYSGSSSSLSDLTGPMAKMLSFGLAPFGVITFIRGLMMLRRVADGNPRSETVGMGITHIVGGVALCNAMAVTCAIGTTFTTTGLSFCG